MTAEISSQLCQSFTVIPVNHIHELTKWHCFRYSFIYFFHWKKFYFQKFLERSDQNKSGDISIAEFIHYVKEHEKNLRLQFSHLDKNKDGEFNKY